MVQIYKKRRFDSVRAYYECLSWVRLSPFVQIKVHFKQIVQSFEIYAYSNSQTRRLMAPSFIFNRVSHQTLCNKANMYISTVLPTLKLLERLCLRRGQLRKQMLFPVFVCLTTCAEPRFNSLQFFSYCFSQTIPI